MRLRFDSALKFGLGRTYYHLARAYHKLGMLDDAHNAYWETKKHAEIKKSEVFLAYAELGLGEILYLQKEYAASHIALSKAEKTFKEKNCRPKRSY